MTPLVGALVGLNVLMFFVTGAMPDLYRAFVFVPADVGHRPWTLITYMFLHGSLSHLVFNMMSLFFFGSQVEGKLGTRRFDEDHVPGVLVAHGGHEHDALVRFMPA